MITLFLNTFGTPVMKNGRAGSTVIWLQISVPSLASTAIRRPSMVAT